MAQYWYFGNRVKVSNPMPNCFRKEVDIVLWNDVVFETSSAAADAAAKEMAVNPGKAYLIQGFTKRLQLDATGLFTGYLEDKV